MQAHAIDASEFTSVFHVVKNYKTKEGKVKMSAFKRFLGASTTESLKRSNKLVAQIQDAFHSAKTSEFTPEEITTLKNELGEIIPLFPKLDNIFDDEIFEFDDQIARQIINNYYTIRDLALDIYNHLKLYQEIDIADKEFEEGKTISHEELFNECP